MKFRTRLMAVILTLLLAVQISTPVLASGTRASAQPGGDVIVNNAEGMQQVVTTESLEETDHLPDGMMVESGENPVTEEPDAETSAIQESMDSSESQEALETEQPDGSSNGEAVVEDSLEQQAQDDAAENASSGEQESHQAQTEGLGVYWNPGSSYTIDSNKLETTETRGGTVSTLGVHTIPTEPEEKNFIVKALGFVANFFGNLMPQTAGEDVAPMGKDSNDGRSPSTPVKSFETAIERARELAEEMEVGLDQITIYSMNPLEIQEGDSLKVDGESVVLQAWEGRNYHSDLLFYLKGGTLSLEHITLAAGDNWNKNEKTPLVQVFDGTVVLERNVCVQGSFAVDYSQQEAEKAWDAGAALLTTKSGGPVIELGQNFELAPQGYSVYLMDQGEGQRHEVIRAPYMTQAKLGSLVGKIDLVGETADQWELQVDSQDSQEPQTIYDPEMQPLNTDGMGKDQPVPTLYAVRATNGTVIYWNPGNAFTINSTEYPAGSDTDRTGLAPNSPVKTLSNAIAQAKVNNTTQIVCMQTLEINDSTAADIKLQGYIGYDEVSDTFQLYGEKIGGVSATITNWDQGLPILDIQGDQRVSMKNVTLQGYTTGSTKRQGNLLTVGLGATLTLEESAQVSGGSYIQLEFGPIQQPNPIQVASHVETSATIYASGIAYAPHHSGAVVVQATDGLVTTGFEGDKQAAGAWLSTAFALAPANTTPGTEEGKNPVVWSLEQSTASGLEHRLLLKAQKSYAAIFVDPIRGDDGYDGITCDFPVKTMERALQVLQAGMGEVLQKRQEAADGGDSPEDIEKGYPLPGLICACSTIIISNEQTWDWTDYQWEDYDGTSVTPVLVAHEDPATNEANEPIHDRMEYVIRVVGGSLTLGNNVHIGRSISASNGLDENVLLYKTNVINVVDGGTLTLTGSAELSGSSDVAEDLSVLYQTYPGTGIVAGVEQPFQWKASNVLVANTAATVTLDETWTGSIHGLSRGIFMVGSGATLTMNGNGSISGNKSNYVGGGVTLLQSAQFTMNGGSISGNYAAAAAGVMVDGYAKQNNTVTKLTMTAGQITGNTIEGRVSTSTNYTSYLGGAGVQTYYGNFEMGTEQGDNNACVISDNRLCRRAAVSSSNWYGIGVSIYQPTQSSNMGGAKAFEMHSGSICRNLVQDLEGANPNQSLYVYGLGLYLYTYGDVTMEGGTISENRLGQLQNTSWNYFYIYGGGICDSIYGGGRTMVIRNVTIQGNEMSKSNIASGYSYFFGGGICYPTSNYMNSNSSNILMENVIIKDNVVDAYSGGYGGGIGTGSIGSSYSADGICLKNVTIEGNRASNSGGGICGNLFSWVSGLTLKNNTASNGGGWYLYESYSSYVDKNEVWEDVVIEGNSATDSGGGIYMNLSASTNRPIALTQSAAGETRITGNQAASGGGLYFSGSGSGSLSLDFPGTWENTATSAGANICAVVNSSANPAKLYLLQGTFVGEKSIWLNPNTDTNIGSIYLDPQQVEFSTETENQTAIYINHPNATVSLLAAGGSSTPIPMALNTDTFSSGNVVVRPANLSTVPTGSLVKDESALGGYRLNMSGKAYEPLTDASLTQDSSGTYRDYITVTGTPTRTQLGALKDSDNETLTVLALIGEGVYLDGTNGKDSSNGLSPMEAVKTWEQAAALLEQYSQEPPTADQKTTGFQPTIWVCGQVTLTDGQTVTLPQTVVSETYQTYEESQGHTPQKAKVQRFSAYNNSLMFRVPGGAAVTVTELIVDGNSSAVVQPSGTLYNFYVEEGGTLKVTDGTSLDNSYHANVYVDGGTLEVEQTYAPGEPEYQALIGNTSSNSSNSNAITLAGTSPQLVMSQYALVGNLSYSGSTAVYMTSSDATITMSDNSRIVASTAVYRAKDSGGAIGMSGQANMHTDNHILNDSTAQTANTLVWTLRDQSSLTTVSSSNDYICYSAYYSSSLSYTLLDESKMTGRWYRGYTSYSQNTSANGSLKIVMGTPGGDDTPSINVGASSYSLSEYSGGQLYLEMNANATFTGCIAFYGLEDQKEAEKAELGEITYGLLMRDNAKMVSGASYGVHIYLHQYNYAGNGYDRHWSQAQPFAITLEDNAAIGYASANSRDFSPVYVQRYLNVNTEEAAQDVMKKYVLGDNQIITLRGNAKLQNVGQYGAIRISQSTSNPYVDLGQTLPVSHVVLEDNAAIERTTTSINSNPTKSCAMLTARKVTLKDSVAVPSIHNQASDPTVYGEGTAIMAHEVELPGTAQVDGPIWLLGVQNAAGELGAITLTSPPTTTDQVLFKLHLASAYAGQVVVKPDGTGVTDASMYLACFENAVGIGETAELELEPQSPNIVLSRQWNVYLSSNGDDSNDGSTPETAVRTFRRAKEILTTKKGYGPGSDIIIPDYIVIQNDDKTWSFEDGGVLTSSDGERWQPQVRRMLGAEYTKALITVDSGAYSTDAAYGSSVSAEEAAAPVVFENITLDDGGQDVALAIGDSRYASNYVVTMLLINTGDAQREVRLGQGAVMRNLDYDMNNNASGVTSMIGSSYAGGFAAHVAAGSLVLDGGVIEEFHVENFSLTSSYTDRVQHAAIVSLEGENASLSMTGGAIRNNSLDISYHGSWVQSSATGILVAANGAQINMSGGAFDGNVLAGDNWQYLGNGYGGYTNADQRRTVGVIALSGSGATMNLSGGSISGNENRLGSDPTPAGKNYADVEGIISIGTLGYYYSSATNVYEGCTFHMWGGSILDNAARHGSAFAVLNGTATLSGGTIRDNESTLPIPSTGESTGWKAEYCPIYVGNLRDTRLNLQGSGCVANDPIYLSEGRQIIITDLLRQTSRLYEIYTGSWETPAGNVVVIPDGDNILDVTPYLHNFHAHAQGMVLDRGREDQLVDTQLGSVQEMNCLVQMKAVFVDGDEGKDPGSVNLDQPQDTQGRSPSNPVQTLDAARAVGQALCYAGEDKEEHTKHTDHYVVYATGSVYNELYHGTVTGGDGSYSKNTDRTNFAFSMEGAAYLCRYTGWALCMGNGLHETGEYCYDTLIKVTHDTATLEDITVRGRREVDSIDRNGETLVVVSSGASLLVKEGAILERNSVTGSRPGQNDPSVQAPIDTRGGAIRAEAGAMVEVSGGVIDSTCTAVTGGSIYLAGAAGAFGAGQLALKNKVNIGGEVYLGGLQNYDAPILVDRSFDPVNSVSIGIQGDYNQKPVVKWTDGTAVTEDMLGLLSFATSITALYEVLPGKVDGANQNNGILLNLRNILYLDPLNGQDDKDGTTPQSAIQTIEAIYKRFQNMGNVPGVLVFVMNPIVIEEGTCVAVTNGSLTQGGTTKYMSVYSKTAEQSNFDSSPTIVHTDHEMVISSQVYFKRYVKTSDEQVPEGYDRESNLQELFVVKGQLQLNGVYLDGYSTTTESMIPGQSALGVVAQAPLVRVEPTGSAQFLSGEMSSHTENGISYQADSTLLTNNTNNKLKNAVLPGSNNIVEGSSAGIEILSSGTENGYNQEQRGRVVLRNTQMTNLQLGVTDSGQVVLGGSDVYQNGELVVSHNTYFHGSVFLEGNGRDGDEASDRLARQTSRWLEVSAYGSPVAAAFELLVRDSYHDRRMVKYPYSTSDQIPASEISYYMLTSAVSRYYTLINELLEAGTGEDFLGTGENTLWLRVPQAIYVDPVRGNDGNSGQYPTEAVKTLEMAFEKMRGLSAKVCYVMNPIPITGASRIYPTGYAHNNEVVQLPTYNVHLEFRRYVRPDYADQAAGSKYNVASFTDGPLFSIEDRGELIIEGSVVVDGHSQPLVGDNVPDEQMVSQGVEVTAPLVDVQAGGKLELRMDSSTGEYASLANNSNTATLSGSQQRMEGGAIYNEGSVTFSGGVLTNNQAATVTSLGTTLVGNADGIYQAGDLTISSYPQGLEGQSVYLASEVNTNSTTGEVNFTSDHILVMDMRLEDEKGSSGDKLIHSLDLDNPVEGRQVVSYPGDSGVDPEYDSYELGTSVPNELFLIESENASNNLELQSWEYLNVSVPEEMFLAVYEYHSRDENAPNGTGVYSQVVRADVDGAGYGVPEYTITNNGIHEVRVTVTGLNQIDSKNDTTMTLAEDISDLTSKDAKLYLAVTKSSETAEEGNQFTALKETSLGGTNTSAELGTLNPNEHGSFAFTGAANASFMDLWLDASFPASSLVLAETRKAYMRSVNAAGETSLNQAGAQFKLTYRIELATSRR